MKRRASADFVASDIKRRKNSYAHNSDVKDKPNLGVSAAHAETFQLHDHNTARVLGQCPSSSKSLSKWLRSEISDGEVYYVPDFISSEKANSWLEELEKLDTWYHPKLKVYGKEVKQSRSIAAYTKDRNLAVRYSGHDVQLHYDYPPLLDQIQEFVEEFLGETFNHVMLNRYASGDEYIGKHRDTKENKVIASLSLGAERTFIMTSSKPSAKPVKRWVLANGSLLVMKGATQDYWKHEIPKEPKIRGVRISLTFRQLR